MPASRTYAVVKRAADAGAAALLLLLTLPVQLVVAGAVALAMGRPVLFRQIRVGRGGAEFVLLKFRSMTAAAGTDAARLTRLGRLLRRTSLDELPSLVNVLAGELSLVGPRPLLPEYLPRYTPEQARRHEVRPGITGLAQVSGRNLLSWDEQFRLDVHYVDHVSARLDLWILGRTVSKVLIQEGISAAGESTRSAFQGAECDR